MADSSKKTDPAAKQSSFLGGGTRFNSVGASYGTPGGDNTPLPPAKNPHAGRTILIVVVLVLLAGALYFLSDPSLGGLVHTPGHGGVSPEQAHPAPPKNF